MEEDEEEAYFEDDNDNNKSGNAKESILPDEQQLASDIFMRESIDGMLDRGIGIFQVIEALRKMDIGIPSLCTARDMMFLIENVQTEGDFIEETFITFFTECIQIFQSAFQSNDEEDYSEPFALSKKFIEERLSDLQPVEGAVFFFTFTSFFVQQAEITDISALAEFEALQNISLKMNNIVDISPLCKIPHLKKLNLAENRVKELKDLEFPNLEELILSQNQIVCIESLSAPKLKKLDISNNKIFFMAPFCLNDCQLLESLNLSNNQIRNIKERTFSGLNNLKSLNLSVNNLTNLAYAFTNEMVKVEDIDLGDNPLQTIQGIENLIGLVVVDLHKTPLELPTDLAPMIDLENLRYLYIYETPMSELEGVRYETIHILSNLEEIDEQQVTFAEKQEMEAIFAERAEEEQRMLEEKYELYDQRNDGEEEEDVEAALIVDDNVEMDTNNALYGDSI